MTEKPKIKLDEIKEALRAYLARLSAQNHPSMLLSSGSEASSSFPPPTPPIPDIDGVEPEQTQTPTPPLSVASSLSLKPPAEFAFDKDGKNGSFFSVKPQLLRNVQTGEPFIDANLDLEPIEPPLPPPFQVGKKEVMQDGLQENRQLSMAVDEIERISHPILKVKAPPYSSRINQYILTPSELELSPRRPKGRDDLDMTSRLRDSESFTQFQQPDSTQPQGLESKAALIQRSLIKESRSRVMTEDISTQAVFTEKMVRVPEEKLFKHISQKTQNLCEFEFDHGKADKVWEALKALQEEISFSIWYFGYSEVILVIKLEALSDFLALLEKRGLIQNLKIEKFNFPLPRFLQPGEFGVDLEGEAEDKSKTERIFINDKENSPLKEIKILSHLKEGESSPYIHKVQIKIEGYSSPYFLSAISSISSWKLKPRALNEKLKAYLEKQRFFLGEHFIQELEVFLDDGFKIKRPDERQLIDELSRLGAYIYERSLKPEDQGFLSLTSFSEKESLSDALKRILYLLKDIEAFSLHDKIGSLGFRDNPLTMLVQALTGSPDEVYLTVLVLESLVEKGFDFSFIYPEHSVLEANTTKDLIEIFLSLRKNIGPSKALDEAILNQRQERVRNLLVSTPFWQTTPPSFKEWPHELDKAGFSKQGHSLTEKDYEAYKLYFKKLYSLLNQPSLCLKYLSSVEDALSQEIKIEAHPIKAWLAFGHFSYPLPEGSSQIPKKDEALKRVLM